MSSGHFRPRVPLWSWAGYGVACKPLTCRDRARLGQATLAGLAGHAGQPVTLGVNVAAPPCTNHAWNGPRATARHLGLVAWTHRVLAGLWLHPSPTSQLAPPCHICHPATANFFPPRTDTPVTFDSMLLRWQNSSPQHAQPASRTQFPGPADNPRHHQHVQTFPYQLSDRIQRRPPTPCCLQPHDSTLRRQSPGRDA